MYLKCEHRKDRKSNVNVFKYFYRLTDTSPYIQVDFREPKLLSGIVTQGEGKEDKWITGFQVYYSIDGAKFIPYSEQQDGNAKIFKANINSDSAVTNVFGQNVIARYLRIVAVTYYNSVALR